MNNKAYIIDIYNPFFKQDNEVYRFNINARDYCVREVELEWGKPQIDLMIDDECDNFQIYNTKEEAIQFARKMMQLNSGVVV